MRKFAALGALAALASISAQAAESDGFSYNLIEGSYAFLDLEGLDVDGPGVNAAFELTPNLFIAGGLQSLEADGGGEIDMLNAGLGLNFPIAPNFDLVGGASFERYKFEGVGSETGWGINGGVRGRVAGSLELTANVKYTDVGDYGNALAWTAGGRWYFTPNFAIGADYTSWDFDDTDVKLDGFLVSLRYDFGNRR